MGRLQDKRLFLLDMDGTIYLDDRLFDGVTAFLSRIREKGGRYLFLTNNSSKGVEGYIEKLNGMGIATGREDYLTSVDTAIDLLRRRYPGRRCYVQGTRWRRRGYPSPVTGRTARRSCSAASTGS